MLIPTNCSRCGMQVELNDCNAFRNVEVAVKSRGAGDYFETDLLCDRCYMELLDSIRRIMEVHDDK